MLTCDLFTVANLLVFHSYNTVSTYFPGIGTIVVYWRVVEFSVCQNMTTWKRWRFFFVFCEFDTYS